jgi:hypothetical protein
MATITEPRMRAGPPQKAVASAARWFFLAMAIVMAGKVAAQVVTLWLWHYPPVPWPALMRAIVGAG